MEIPHQTHADSEANTEHFGSVPNRSEDFRNLPKAAETFRTLPNHSESFGTVPNHSDDFRTVRKEAHTTTVREAARMFEQAGVARTERSIVNWCQPNATGIARLDAYFDPNERRYYITEQSIQNAIAEEKAKALRSGQNVVEPVPKNSEAPPGRESTVESKNEEAGNSNHFKLLEQEVFNLKILNSGKDFYIQRLTQERDGFIKQMVEGSKRIGELETRLLQLEGARQDGDNLPRI